MSNLLSVFGAIPPQRLDLFTRVFCIVLFLGLAVKSVLMNHLPLAVILVCLAGIILVNLTALQLGRRPPVPLSVLVVVLTATILMTTHYVGIAGAIWMFPTLIGLRFAGRSSQHLPARLALIVLVPVLIFLQGDAPNAARLFAAALIASAYLWLAEGEILSLRAKLDLDEGRDPLTRAYGRARLERDRALIPAIAPVGLVLLRLDGVLELRARQQGDRVDQVLARVVREVEPMLNTRERLYRLGGGDFLVALAGWRSFESYELGQQLCKSLQPLLPKGVILRCGVSEVYEPAALEAALEIARAQVEEASARGAPPSPAPAH
ncbi:GGDEF domain-containing protein [Epibacterium sp. Ofav1-8]|uniref:GGDEF domain-containing protein n=1 Tax=Epibacterium sp. Ofav1-8 TaxID=2917735 RepID=UPI001EF567E0|nr:GGDEF domain-containing protein [Epibacterium sp. Ofav1-8]